MTKRFKIFLAVIVVIFLAANIGIYVHYHPRSAKQQACERAAKQAKADNSPTQGVSFDQAVCNGTIDLNKAPK